MGARQNAHDAYLFALNALLGVPVHRLREWVFRTLARNQLGRGSTVGRSVRLTCRGGVTVGARTYINRGVTLDGRGTLTIGSDVDISPEVMLLTADHDPHAPTFDYRVRPTVIGDRVWLASRALVLPGSQVGAGAVAAGGAVVHGIVEPWTIVAGNPATAIAERSRDAQARFRGGRRHLLQ